MYILIYFPLHIYAKNRNRRISSGHANVILPIICLIKATLKPFTFQPKTQNPFKQEAFQLHLYMTRSSSVVVVAVDGLDGNEEKLLRKLAHTSLNKYSGNGRGRWRD